VVASSEEVKELAIIIGTSKITVVKIYIFKK